MEGIPAKGVFVNKPPVCALGVVPPKSRLFLAYGAEMEVEIAWVGADKLV